MSGPSFPAPIPGGGSRARALVTLALNGDWEGVSLEISHLNAQQRVELIARLLVAQVANIEAVVSVPPMSEMFDGPLDYWQHLCAMAAASGD